ncbi:hypothetical protein EEB14_24840 [Rhodococcus sp. WS4]|nr:hypothetical protein EEB14_24840 [Rhodococcus sp. WS4]
MKVVGAGCLETYRCSGFVETSANSVGSRVVCLGDETLRLFTLGHQRLCLRQQLLTGTSFARMRGKEYSK